jgi:hypothetical protein
MSMPAIMERDCQQILFYIQLIVDYRRRVVRCQKANNDVMWATKLLPTTSEFFGVLFRRHGVVSDVRVYDRAAS